MHVTCHLDKQLLKNQKMCYGLLKRQNLFQATDPFAEMNMNQAGMEPKLRVLSGPGTWGLWTSIRPTGGPGVEGGRRQRDREGPAAEPGGECQGGIKGSSAAATERRMSRHKMRPGEGGHLRVPAFTLEPRGKP